MSDEPLIDSMVVPVLDVNVGRSETVVIDYTNYRGERGLRRIWPLAWHFGINKYHSGPPQWFVVAIDLDKGALRVFAMKDIHSWQPDEPFGRVVPGHSFGEARTLDGVVDLLSQAEFTVGGEIQSDYAVLGNTDHLEASGVDKFGRVWVQRGNRLCCVYDPRVAQ